MDKAELHLSGHFSGAWLGWKWDRGIMLWFSLKKKLGKEKTEK